MNTITHELFCPQCRNRCTFTHHFVIQWRCGCCGALATLHPARLIEEERSLQAEANRVKGDHHASE